MKNLFFSFLIITHCIPAISQSVSTTITLENKTAIDTNALNNWSFVAEPVISDDGLYFAYTIRNPAKKSTNLIIQSTNGLWQQTYSNTDKGSFLEDSKRFLFLKKDSLYLVSPGSSSPPQTIPHVASYKKTFNKQGDWVAYLLKTEKQELVLYNIRSNQQYHFQNVNEYDFSPKGDILLLKLEYKENNDTINKLTYIQLAKGNEMEIWSSTSGSKHHEKPLDYSFDGNGSQLIFIVQNTTPTSANNSIWYYKFGMDKAVMRVGFNTPGITTSYEICNNKPLFTPNGKSILFKLKECIKTPAKQPYTKVDIWSYKDSVLQSTQLLSLNQRPLTATIAAEGGQIIQLEKKDEQILLLPNEFHEYGVVQNNISIKEYWWNKKRSYYLTSFKDGSRKLLKTGTSFYSSFSFSPRGNTLIYYDPNIRSYVIYNVKTGSTRNLSGSLDTKWETENYDRPGSPPPVGIAGWSNNDEELYLYDNYDIWKIYLHANKPAECITNHYGQLHGLKFRIVDEERSMKGIAGNAGLLLTAFNIDNKQNGFYRIRLNKTNDPQLLVMGPYIYYQSRSYLPGSPLGNGMKPLKAKSKNVWVVERQSATEAPNFYLTADFIRYTPLTNIHPHTTYNWLTKELVKWKQPNGFTLEGILYKPENFKPNRKYPIIFNYYEQLSYNLYNYPQPELSNSTINIPWFVSNGYIVFTPDINYKIGDVGESINNTIISAAKYFSKMPWIDSTKMGIQGHSFGGYETNYVITHTNIFAAAVSASGASNLISAYGNLAGGALFKEISRQSHYEIGQARLGTTLWQNPDIYIRNSPIFYVDKVSTPLLLMHNKADGSVPWSQGMEFYLGLRRLGKKVWMLQYDNGEHGVDGPDALDYTIRITQFFDYYLKGTLPPKWMTIGITANNKATETGFELDPSGVQP